MGINEQYFSAAMERLEERRRANRLESDMRRSEVESKIPEYRELSLKLGETGSEIVRLVMRGGDTSKELAEVERRNLEIQKAPCGAALRKRLPGGLPEADIHLSHLPG